MAIVTVCFNKIRKFNSLAPNCRILHNEELYTLYYSPDIFRVIRLRRM
jgi:hypothetical protein